jgi:4-hydroxy-tetrahydrodipicolinate synthase
METSARNGLVGVYTIVSTPFEPDGSIDYPSLARLLDATIEAGVDGVTLLGVASETKKLTADERRRVVDFGLETIAGRVPVVIGTSEDGTDATVAASRQAEADGAAALLVAPPTFVGPGPGLTRHYTKVGEAVDVPIVLQDFPPINGVVMSPADMAALVEAVPTITTIKLEGPPTPQRMAQTLDLTGDEVTIVGGLGGLYLYYELESGSAGTMTGFSYSEVLLAIWRAWRDGDREAAAEAYERYLPILVCEGQANGIAIRKQLLARRGVIAHPTMRAPAPALHPRVLAQMEGTVERLRLDAEFPVQAAQRS